MRTERGQPTRERGKVSRCGMLLNRVGWICCGLGCWGFRGRVYTTPRFFVTGEGCCETGIAYAILPYCMLACYRWDLHGPWTRRVVRIARF